MMNCFQFCFNFGFNFSLRRYNAASEETRKVEEVVFYNTMDQENKKAVLRRGRADIARHVTR